MMTKELDNVKLKINNLLEKRNELLNSKQQEKIDLINQSNLDGLFSRLVYSSTETVENLKNKLNKKTRVDEEIASLNEELLMLTTYLKELKESYLKEMDLLARKPGKKRRFNGRFGRKDISEKYYKKYMSLYNTVNELDDLDVYLLKVINEKVETNYQINKEYVKSLDAEEKAQYYSSIAALIMCDQISEPTSVLINKEVTVNEKDANTLIECYRAYRAANVEMEKQKKKSIFTKKIKGAFKKVKNSLKSAFGLDRGSNLNFALRKSVAVASLYAGVISTALSAPLSNANLNSSALVNEDMNQTLLEDSNSGMFVLKEFILMKDTNEGKLKLIEPLKGQDSVSLAATNAFAAAEMVTEKLESRAASFEEEKLEDRVEENACEIIEVVNINADDNSEAQSLEGEQAKKDNTPTSEPVILVSVDSGVDADITTQLASEDELTVQSVEIAPNERIPGFHLTFNNTTYNFSKDEIKPLYFVTSHEYNGTYEDALTIVSIIINRIEDPRYPDNLIDVLSEEGQFVVWEDVLREISKYGDDFEMNEDVYNAINDVVNRGVRNNDYVEFKASWSPDYSKTGEYKYQLSEGGNKCHNVAVSLDRTSKSDGDIKEEEANSLEKGKTLNKKL